MTVSRTLTDAEIKALPTIFPVLLTGVPGKIIVPLLAIYEANFTTAYSNGGGGGGDVDNQLVYNNGAQNVTESGSFVSSDAPFDRFQYLLPQSPISGFNTMEATDLIGKAVSIASFNGGGNFTGGNVANTLRVTLIYQLITP